MLQFRDIDLTGVTTLLCDADGNLFPSEEPAFDASAELVDKMLTQLGVQSAFTGEELRRVASGRSFRSIVTDLAGEAGVDLDEGCLDVWAARELDVVTQRLGSTLGGDARVRDPLQALAKRFDLAVVSSSALSRLAVCFAATGLDELFPTDRWFSAADSLSVPTSKPDPAIYTLAGESLGLRREQGLAIEDAAAGVTSASAAGFEVLGNVMFVAPAERPERIEQLREAGAGGVLQDWSELLGVLDDLPDEQPVGRIIPRPGPSRGATPSL